MKKRVINYGIQYYGHHDNAPGIYVTVSDLSLWWWIADQIVSRHPHWEWWTRMWDHITPDYGDPFCYWYCFHFSQARGWKEVTVSHDGPVKWEDIPKKDQDVILADLRLTQWSDAEDNLDPAPLVTQMRKAGLL